MSIDSVSATPPCCPTDHDDTRWEAVSRRDRDGDGLFVFAVRSTGIYCRPSCPARRPRRENVRFFAGVDDAERAGFRPCKRCRPCDAMALDGALVERVCRYIDDHPDDPTTLAALGAHVGLSPSHLQRVFTGVMGVSPRQYAAARRMERVKERLRGGETVTTALYDAGYGSSSGLYAQTARLGMTPSIYGKGGGGMTIAYTTTPSPLGWLLLAATERGLCSVRFGESDADLEGLLEQEFPKATRRRDDTALQPWVDAILACLDGDYRDPFDLPLDVRATAFQARVWDALKAIPYGDTRSYQEVAEEIGRHTATRAVARACATNPVALAIPCHRVVRTDGNLGGYRWGLDRKRALLERERERRRSERDHI